MTESAPGAAAPHRRPGAEPVGMTEAEKRAAEWEARHDVAARGRHSAPDALQHYVAHERLTRDSAGDATRSHGAGAAPPPAPAQTGPPVQDVAPAEGRRPGRWFRRLRRRRD